MSFWGTHPDESLDARNFCPGSHFFDIASEKKLTLRNRLSRLGLNGYGIAGKARGFAVHELSYNRV
ncbi:MAG: hypothetical protein AMK69_28650 [Nitrospira bacterium SG8_3]|nr:MAG: hypothetical protein AMK69_28650 [Nitrospira bacterium SG8_3]